MAPVTNQEPQSANDYDDRITAAVKSVLIEIAQILGSFRGKFAVIGGIVPTLVLTETEMAHIGTTDIDLSLDAESLGDGEYADLVQALMNSGYGQRGDRRFQLVREVSTEDEGEPINIIVDFLMPRDAKVILNKPALIDEFAVQRADGAALALRFPQRIQLEGKMPDGSRNRVEIAVASIPALLAMKGFAINNRMKRKDAYDIYYCVRNYSGGFEQLAQECRAVLATDEGKRGYGHIAEKFHDIDGFGPQSVCLFVEGTDILDGRTPDQWQQDAFGQVNAWLGALGLRK